LAPAALRVLDREVDELSGCLLGGDVSSGLDRLADLAVERFDRVGRVDDAADVGREGEKGNDVLQASRQVLPIIG
jgi:hypothetical protein